MGYDLHITRRRRWDGKGPAITAQEWLEFVERDPELQLDGDEGSRAAVWRPDDAPAVESPAWLAWSDGEIYTKNPDEPLLAKMVSIAAALGTTVQGDDGEVYRATDEPPQEIPLSFMERMAIWLAQARSLWRRPGGAEAPDVILPFDVGERVFDVVAEREYTVIAIDLEADHALGWILCRGDDGSERRYSAIAHGLRPADHGRRMTLTSQALTDHLNVPEGSPGNDTNSTATPTEPPHSVAPPGCVEPPASGSVNAGPKSDSSAG